MITYQIGERVDVQIQDAEVIDSDDDILTIRYESSTHFHYIDIRSNAPAIHISPHALRPKAGDIWQLADEQHVVLYEIPFDHLVARHLPYGDDEHIPASKLDFTNAVLRARLFEV